MQPADEGHFIAVPAEASRMVVRFVPQTASQFAAFGLACRSSLAADASAVTLLVLPGSGVGRRRGWHVRLMARNAPGTATILSDTALAAPVVSYGRLVGGLWLRVQAQGPMLDAAFSPDGTSWTMAGRLPRPAEGRLGLIAASGIPEVGTAVHFDIVTL